MSTLLIYAIKSAILLTLLLLPGILLLFREKMFRFNRATLLSIMVMSLVLPLCNFSHLSMDDVPTVQTIEIGLLQAGFPVEVADYEIEAEQTHFPWFYVVSILYAIGVTVVLSIRMREIFSMERIMRLGSIWQKQEADGIRIFCHAGNVAPFSWLRSIVIGEQDYQDSGREIILHEKAHILHRHSLDILLLTFVEALQWWNPFVYLLGMYLRDIHEYQADGYVLSHGISCHAYSELIIRKAVGASSYTFANSFNHSLTKKRITMMLNSNPSPWRRSRVLYVIPVAALALSAFATPEFKSASDLIEETVQTQDKITESSANKQTEDEKNADAWIVINRNRELMFKSGDGEILHRIEPAELMDAIRSIKGERVLNIMYDPETMETIENWKGTARQTDNLKINLIEFRSPNQPNDETASEDEETATQTDTLLQGLAGRIPGAEIGDDGSVYLNGKKVRKLLVNDKELINGETVSKDKETAYKTVDSPAQFTGGQEAFGKWVSENMVYPPKAQEQGIQGQVAVQFIVEKDGSITEVEGIRSPDQLLTDEAVRLVKAMPKWIPAKNKGEIVRCVFVVTLAFRLS